MRSYLYMKILKKGDVILIIITLILSMSAMYYTKRINDSIKSNYISIQLDGKEIKKVYFGKEVFGKEIPIKSQYGYNLIEIGDNRVRVKKADCPDKLDVRQGWIDRAGQTIICLPNRLVIEIKGDREIDYISR